MVNDFDAYDDGGLDVTRCVRCQQLVPTSEILQVPCVGKVCEICDEEMTQKSEIVATWNQNGDNSCTCGANGWCDHIEQAKALAMVTGSIETTYSINNSQKAVN